MTYGCLTAVSSSNTPWNSAATVSSSNTLRIEYRVTFDGGEAWETYDWRFDGGETRLLAYTVETGFQEGTADWEITLAPPGVRPNATTCTVEEDVHWWEGKRQE